MGAAIGTMLKGTQDVQVLFLESIYLVILDGNYLNNS
jgi:hypothetical protein